jgi:hypothetical protein
MLQVLLELPGLKKLLIDEMNAMTMLMLIWMWLTMKSILMMFGVAVVVVVAMVTKMVSWNEILQILMELS